MRIRIKQSRPTASGMADYLRVVAIELEKGETSGDGWKLLKDNIMTGVTFDKNMGRQIEILYYWCQKHNTTEFKTSQIKDLLNKSQYARTGDIPHFGGLTERIGKGHYRINIQRCRDFIDGRMAIPTRAWKDDNTGKFTGAVDHYKYKKDIGYLPLNDDGNYIPEKAKQSELL